MATVDDILVGNLGDALQQAQRYVLSGIVSAAPVVLLSMDMPELMSLKQKVDVPTVGQVAPGPAFTIVFLAYLTFGFLANSAIGRIRRIASAITEVPIAEATLTRLSLVTLDNTAMRIGATLMAPLLVVVAYVLEQSRVVHPSDNIIRISGCVLISVPYLVLAYRLRKPIER